MKKIILFSTVLLVIFIAVAFIRSNHLQMGDKYVRTLFISGYPYVANTGWLNMLPQSLIVFIRKKRILGYMLKILQTSFDPLPKN